MQSQLQSVIQKLLDNESKKLEVNNCYLLLFVSTSAVEQEKAYIVDFALKLKIISW